MGKTDFKIKDDFQALLMKANYFDLLFLKTQAATLIEEAIENRKLFKQAYIGYNVHREIIKMEDLCGEGYFPCDFRLLPFYGHTIVVDDIHYIFYMIPMDYDVLRRLINRSIPKEEQKKHEEAIQILLSYSQPALDGVYDLSQLSQETQNTICMVAQRCMGSWLTDLEIPIQDYKEGTWKNVWIGIENGKLTLSAEKKPRYIKLIKDITKREDPQAMGQE